MNKTKKKILKRIARFSQKEYIEKNINWFETIDDTSEFMSVETDNYSITSVDDFLLASYYDLIGIRNQENQEWDFIPLPLLVKLLYGENLTPVAEMKRRLQLRYGCNYYMTRDDWNNFNDDDDDNDDKGIWNDDDDDFDYENERDSFGEDIC